MNIEQANNVAMSVILNKLGRVLQRDEGNIHLYLSPFRDKETEPQFEVNVELNTWHDRILERGGDVVELVRFHLFNSKENSLTPDILRWIGNMLEIVPRIRPVPVEDGPSNDHLILKNIRPIKMGALFRYGFVKGIPKEVLRAHLKEAVLYDKTNGEQFYALAMKNESGGYTLKNSFFDGRIGERDITFIRGRLAKPRSIYVFHDLLDYMSTIAQNKGVPLEHDTIILHSLNLLDAAYAMVKNYGYRFAFTLLDNNQPGNDATQSWSEFCKTEDDLIHMPINDYYLEFETVNEWHCALIKR